MKLRLSIVLSVIVLSYSCFQNKEHKNGNESKGSQKILSKNNDELKARGTEITLALQQTLAAKLKTAIADSGIAHALQFCSLNAYPLTDSISKIHGVTIKRVSHRARNPANNANEQDLKKIMDYSNAVSAGEMLLPVIEETEQLHTFYAPILLSSPLCLNCHGIPGKDILPENFIVINKLYPEDKATGFALNDLRGLWRVDFRKEAIREQLY